MDRDLYRERNVVERLVGKLKEYRRIATRLQPSRGHAAAQP
jgi:transposase